MMDVKSVPFNLKSLTETGEFTGYAAVFHTADFGGDVIMPGAFKKTLSDSKGDLPVLWQHHDLIGKNLAAHEDSRGLFVHGQINLEVQRGKEAHSLAKQGAVKGLSIGYLPVTGKVDYDEEGNRILRELRLFEYSLTPLPMHRDARLAQVKEQGSDHEEAVKALRCIHSDLEKFYSNLFDGD